MNFLIKDASVSAHAMYEFIDAFTYQVFQEKPYFNIQGKEYRLVLEYLMSDGQGFNNNLDEYYVDTLDNARDLLKELQHEMSIHAPGASVKYQIKKVQVLESNY